MPMAVLLMEALRKRAEASRKKRDEDKEEATLLICSIEEARRVAEEKVHTHCNIALGGLQEDVAEQRK